MEKIFPENIFTEKLNFDKVYYETRNFIKNALPFSLHTDYMVKTANHYVHKHREVELLVGISGSGQVIADLKTIPIKEREIVVINPNKVHYIISESVFTYYCIIADSEFLAANGIDIASLSFEEHFEDPELLSLVERLNTEWKIEDSYRNQVLRSILIEIMVRLCRSHTANDTMAENESRTLQKIKLSINYIKTHYQEDLSLDLIAKEAGLSKYHYCREFKKATDLTPIEFINRTRCEHAKSLLESNKYSIAEISERCGFATSAHFSKTFRGFFDVYPSDYNKLGRDNRADKASKYP